MRYGDTIGHVKENIFRHRMFVENESVHKELRVLEDKLLAFECKLKQTKNKHQSTSFDPSFGGYMSDRSYLMRRDCQSRNNYNEYIDLHSKKAKRNLFLLNTLKNSANITILDEKNYTSRRNSHKGAVNSFQKNKKQPAKLILKPSQKDKGNTKKDIWKTEYNKLKDKYIEVSENYNKLTDKCKLLEHNNKLQQRRIRELEKVIRNKAFNE